MAVPVDKFELNEIASITAKSVLDSYQCMSDVIRKVFVCKAIEIAYSNGSVRVQDSTGFFAFNDTLIFLSQSPLTSDTPIESAFVCMSADRPSRIFKDAFPCCIDSISSELLQASTTLVYSTPSMLFNWTFSDTLPLRFDDAVPMTTDYHTDVSVAAQRINKYMKVPPGKEPVQAIPSSVVTYPVVPISVNLAKKRPRDAREFREQILSNGAQGEFFVWSHIKARYGDAADLSWWMTSAKRQFFPQDFTPIDDSIGSDFFIPKDDHCLFASKRGGPVHIEVKGTGRTAMQGDKVTFEISRNELKTFHEVTEKGQEYVVAVVSGLAGMGRPKLETIVRDLDSLELVPTRFIATVVNKKEAGEEKSTPPLTQSNWYT